MSSTRATTRFSPRGADTFRLAVTGNGFEVNVISPSGTRNIPVAWNEVKRIEAFKNYFNQACACLVFALTDGSSVELNENLIGWTEVVGGLPRALSGCVPMSDWWTSASPDMKSRTIYYRYSISGMGGKSA